MLHLWLGIQGSSRKPEPSIRLLPAWQAGQGAWGLLLGGKLRMTGDLAHRGELEGLI